MSTTYIRNFEKKRIKCYDESTQQYRNLEPDCMIELVNGKRAGIELDGRQHFESVNYFGSTPTDLQDQISRDRAKNKTLWQQGYSMLRISYLEYDKIEEHFSAFIQRL